MKNRFKGQYFTTPNILSYFRFVMIPMIIVFYQNEMRTAAFLTVIVSGLTDIVDGQIARKFNMVSDLGKLLDPLADKLTLLSVMLCIALKKHFVLIPLCLLAIKEIGGIILSYIAIKKTDKVNSSKWFGKLCTVSIYCSIALYMIWPSMPDEVALSLIVICSSLIVLASVLYIKLFNEIIAEE